MEIYYAHAMCIYGSDDEKEEINHITINFPESKIVDPGSYANNPQKRKDGMEYCKKLVNTCDAVVFTKLMSKITSGVGIEIHHALLQNKSVYELKNGKILVVKTPPKYISRDETIVLYRKWRMRKISSNKN